jgi:hypothetical protein
MSTVLSASAESAAGHGRKPSEVLDRLIRTWDVVAPSSLRENALYLFVMPTNRMFAVYQGRENGSLRVRTTPRGPAREIEAKTVRSIYKIGGDITVAEELNKRFS